MMDEMSFETLPLFSKPHFSWNLHTDYVGRRFQYRPYTESTMDDARHMMERWRFANGTILLAETQTSGRGRAGRAWVSPPDVGLYFTLTLSLPSADPRPLAYVTPLAIAEAIEDLAARNGATLHVDLKWPNDALIGGKKVGGVLIEMAEKDGEPVALIGVGINVNLATADYPEIAGIATSLRDVLGYEVPREELLAAFCDHFEERFEESKTGSRAPFEAWKQRLVTLGSEVVATGAETIRGVAVDVNDDGTLVIEQPDGTRRTVEAGDVTLARQGS